MVRAYVFSRHPGAEASSNINRFHRRFGDLQDPPRVLCGFLDVVPDRSTFARTFRCLDEAGALVDEVFDRISQLLRERPWVVPVERVRPARLGGGSDSYREQRHRNALGLEEFMDEIYLWSRFGASRSKWRKVLAEAHSGESFGKSRRIDAASMALLVFILCPLWRRACRPLWVVGFARNVLQDVSWEECSGFLLAGDGREVLVVCRQAGGDGRSMSLPCPFLGWAPFHSES